MCFEPGWGLVRWFMNMDSDLHFVGVEAEGWGGVGSGLLSPRRLNFD